jgi:hypothetical protein
MLPRCSSVSTASRSTPLALTCWFALELFVVAAQRFGIVLWAAAHLAFCVLFAGLEVGLLRICLSLSDGSDPRYRLAFSGLALGPRFLAAQLTYLGLVVVGLGCWWYRASILRPATRFPVLGRNLNGPTEEKDCDCQHCQPSSSWFWWRFDSDSLRTSVSRIGSPLLVKSSAHNCGSVCLELEPTGYRQQIGFSHPKSWITFH